MNANRQAIVGDCQTLGAQVMQYYRTPSSQGEVGGYIGTGDTKIMNQWLGWGGNPYTSDSGLTHYQYPHLMLFVL